METWNEFCTYLIDCKERNVSEQRYHEIIESQLSILGWKRFKGEICHKERIPSGHGFAEPDIVIKKDGISQIVIEVKKPVHVQTKDERVQLLSYMRLCMLQVGIYIGEHIEIFYDIKDGSTEPTSVYKVPLSLNEKRGKRFIELIKRESFDASLLIEFCEEQLKEQKRQKSLRLLKEDLLNSKYVSYLKDCLKQRFIEQENFSNQEKQIEDLINSLQINIKTEESPEHTECAENILTTYSSKSLVTSNISSGRDNTRYSLDDSAFLSKGRFALAVVSKYVRIHPDKRYEEILTAFPDNLGISVVIKQLTHISPKQLNDRRFFSSPNEILSSSDGIRFAVTTQWTISTIQNIVNFAKAQGWNVKSSK